MSRCRVGGLATHWGGRANHTMPSPGAGVRAAQFNPWAACNAPHATTHLERT
jgi:hypothetical protein